MKLSIAVVSVLFNLGIVIDRVNGDSGDSCKTLRRCLKRITGKKVESPDPGASLPEFCDALLQAFEGDKGVDIMCAVANRFNTRRRRGLGGRYYQHPASGPSHPKQAPKKNIFETSAERDYNLFGGTTTPEPACLTPFDPFYADESGINTAYDTYVASIEGLYVLEGKLERSNDDAYAELKIGWGAALTAAALATEIPLAATAANEVLAVFEIVIDQVDTHDNSVDSTEIEAAFENTQLLLTQTCNIIEQIDGVQERVDNRLHKIEDRLDDIEDRLGNIEHLLHMLVYQDAYGY